MNMPIPQTSVSDISAETMSSVILDGNLAKLDARQRVEYMLGVCKSLGLNPTTKPFEFVTLNGKLQMYARKDCTEQLRKLHGVSIQIKAREVTSDCYVVTACATDKTGKVDESIGAVPIGGVKGEALSNAMMKAETKAKRRVTLSICGLGMLDETEVSSIPNAEILKSGTASIAELPAGAVVGTELNSQRVAEGLAPVVDSDGKAKCKSLYEQLKAINRDAMKIGQEIKHKNGTDYEKMADELAYAIRCCLEGVAEKRPE